MLLLLAVIQYRWSAELANNDAKLTKTRLGVGAQTLADEFDHRVADLYLYAQTKGADSIENGAALTNPPRLFGELYHVSRKNDEYVLRRVERDGSVHDIDARDQAGQALARRYGASATGNCWSHLWPDIPAIVAPVLFKPTGGAPREPVHCLVATLDSTDLHNLLSELIQQNFGTDSSGRYSFAVVESGESRRRAMPLIYGIRSSHADLGQAFFGFRRDNYINERMREQLSPKHPFLGWMGSRSAGPPPTGLWELQVSHGAGSIESAVAGWRERTVLINILLEGLLLVTIAVVIVSALRMRRLGEEKVQFAAGVSHELRTPISAIGLLSRNMATGLVVRPEAVKNYGALIYEQTQRLSQMVEQTLEFAGIDSAQMTPTLKKVSVQRLIEQVIERNRDNLTQKGFNVNVEIAPNLPTIMADSQWLARAVENLVNNAEKYNSDKRWIGVSASYSGESAEVRITVEDRGIGIDTADFDRIFEPFSRGRRAVDAQIPGSGIGLALVRRTVEAHRGSITFVSEPNQGSSFTLHLPASPATLSP